MRNEVKCCCGATATFQTFTNGMGEAYDVRQAYERWMSQHNACPALYAKPEPRFIEATGPFADFRIEVPSEYPLQEPKP